MKNKAEVTLKIEEKTVVEEMEEIFKALNEEEQREMRAMMRGLKMGMAIKENEKESREPGQAS